MRLVSQLLVSQLIGSPAMPGLLRPADVGSLAAWRSLVADGRLAVVRDDAAVEAHTPITAEVRAAAISHLVTGRRIVVGRTAAWIHAGGPAPEVIELAYRCDGFRIEADSRRVEGFAGAEGIDVLTPERALADLARTLPRDEALAWIERLTRSGASLAKARIILETPSRIPGRAKARRLLREAARAD